MKRICNIYKSSKRNEMYLYVLKSDELKRVPESLLLAFGTPTLAFSMILTPERALAREDIHQVLENLDNQGYHLQMPPQEEDYIQHLPEELLRRNDPV
ncbi:YcgL domain-containing protein [Pseudomonas sp. NPDC078700]|uniref:YcgL domain-containing protein n=1 Tax=Pseudomonas sp. NPDC078700 TaxID=3364424 RepID=UPI0037C855A7